MNTEKARDAAVLTTLLIGAAVAAAVPGASAVAAGNAMGANQGVRVKLGSVATGAITGKTRTLDGCLYVQLDRAAPGGITLVRMDQVTHLQVLSGDAWVARDLKAVLAREPAHCFAEANG